MLDSIAAGIGEIRERLGQEGWEVVELPGRGEPEMVETMKRRISGR
jgi:hypothetical protein